MIINKLLSKLDTLGQIEQVKAHCDVPCKIYDPGPAIIAALSVARMIQLMEELENKGKNDLQAKNTFARYVREKEDQASICKKEIRIIWGDYFKQPQFDKHPELHELTHSIMMAASKAKQEPSEGVAHRLVELVNNFATIFWETKNIETAVGTSPYPPNLQVVFPVLK